MEALERSWVEIDAGRLAANLHAVQAAAGEATVLAVIKADGYGHGAELCAPVLARAGARWFGVTDAAEGMRVRKALDAEGFCDTEILPMCGGLPEEAAAMGRFRLTPVVWTPGQVRALSGMSQIEVHIEIDTGMGRQGARPGEPLDEVLAAALACGVRVSGVFTHLCSSEEAHSAVTAMQKDRFATAVAQVLSRGIVPEWLHIANSSAVDNFGETRGWMAELARGAGARTMVRPGLALYGYVLPMAGGVTGQGMLGAKLRPVLTWKTRVLALRELVAGDTVGYGATFTAPSAMGVALLPAGYADGLRREFSRPGSRPGACDGGWVIAAGPDRALCRCAVLGRVSMNLTVVDVSGAPWIAAGDAVTLLGDGITAEDHARIAGTIPYEILCGLRSQARVLVNEPG